MENEATRRALEVWATMAKEARDRRDKAIDRARQRYIRELFAAEDAYLDAKERAKRLSL